MVAEMRKQHRYWMGVIPVEAAFLTGQLRHFFLSDQAVGGAKLNHPNACAAQGVDRDIICPLTCLAGIHPGPYSHSTRMLCPPAV